MLERDNEFLNRVASPSPTPGGGAVCAYVGALASALASMVGNLTVGKKRYAHVEEQIQENLVLLADCRSDLVDLMQADEYAFNELVKCWKMPKDTILQRRARKDAEQKALVGACDVPLQIMCVCAKVIELDALMAYEGNRTVLSDAGACASLAKGALEAAALSVYVNTASMEDQEKARMLNQQAADLVRTFGKQADQLYQYAVSEVSA